MARQGERTPRLYVSVSQHDRTADLPLPPLSHRKLAGLDQLLLLLWRHNVVHAMQLPHCHSKGPGPPVVKIRQAGLGLALRELAKDSLRLLKME